MRGIGELVGWWGGKRCMGIVVKGGRRGVDGGMKWLIERFDIILDYRVLGVEKLG